jgi:replication factor C subunit 2/4
MEEDGISTAASATATSSSSTLSSNIPWIEKYRPRILDDVIGNEETIARLNVIAKEGNMPNIILSGPPVSFSL